MITEQDLKEAIAECEGTPHPNASTCIKLAAFYTILKNMQGEEIQPTISLPQAYSYDGKISLDYSESEFSQLTESKGIERVFPVIDELMETLMVLNPKLYHAMIRKIEDL